MPILENIFEALQVMHENRNLLVSTDSAPLGESFGYKEMLQKFWNHFPLGSVLLRKDAFQLCSREALMEAKGTWHAYALIVFDAASRVNKRYKVLYCNRLSFRAAVRNVHSESSKTYVMDAKMVRNIKKWASLLDTAVLNEQERRLFYYNLIKVSHSWVA